jgi:hypothetical protein
MRIIIVSVLLLCLAPLLHAADLVTLTPETWNEYAPAGKEADCIYGDFVLRNDQITAVVANPISGRDANHWLREMGGAVLDLTVNDRPSDQLSAFLPGARKFALRFDQVRGAATSATATTNGPGEIVMTIHDTAVELICRSLSAVGIPSLVVAYRLADGEPWLVVTSTFSNDGNEPIEVDLADHLAAERTFERGTDAETNVAWWYDKWFGQAYGVVAEQRQVVQGTHDRKKGMTVQYVSNDESTVRIAPGEQYELVRRIFPGRNLIDVRAVANRLAGKKNHQVTVSVTDAAGPVANADMLFMRGDERYAWGRTEGDGSLINSVPAGEYMVDVESPARGGETITIDVRRSDSYSVSLPLPGYIEGHILADGGGPIPCKVQFRGAEGTPDPDFGPDSGEHAVKNLYYTANGSFRHDIAPGTYEVIISHGPEYDAVYQRIEVRRGEVTPVEMTLVRTVDTPGWVSTDFHSHSSPSGDNTGSQFGRVLNLLAEHLEFAPCTEHNRLSSYAPHLKRLDAEQLMATCVGMELTEGPGWVNHQNAFPLIPKSRTQHGGGPRTHHDPVAQIERLALWDDGSDKLVQQNHPNIVNILGDRDQDGEPDGGFAEVFGFMDVIEVHPPDKIFSPPELEGGNRIGNWLQLLNLGYRIPGVVNTDAHYNFHGSGWLRNYVRCPTDNPADIKTLEIVHACERGNLIITNGPYLEVQLSADGTTVISGEDIHVNDGKAELYVRVQCPNWFDVDRVQVFLNGRATEDLNFRRRVAPDKFSTETVRFEQTIPLLLEQDTHVIVAAVGEESELGPVMGPEHGKDRPVAVSNPIFVDVDGDGFAPNGDLLGVEMPLIRDEGEG